MYVRVLAALCWLGLIVEAVVAAPVSTPEVGQMVRKMLTMQVQGMEPGVVAIFNMLGVLPLLFACLLLPEPQELKVPAWPFVFGAFVGGAFALFPYLILRNPAESQTPATGWRSWFEARPLGALLLLCAASFIVYGLGWGSLSRYIALWKTNQLVHIMTLDFVVLCLLIPFVTWQDAQRRGRTLRGIAQLFLVPVLGTAAYLVWRKGNPVES